MPVRPNRRLNADTVDADRNVLNALRNIPTYAPANPAFKRDVLDARSKELDAARLAEFHAQNALAAARDAAIAAEWAFHEAMLGTKDQVIAQFGADSNEVQALGLKKRSERKRRTVRPRLTADANA